MPYFSYLPDVKVRVSSFRNNNVEPFVVAKNIFRRCKLVEDIQDAILGFQQYTIMNNQRPDQVAFEVYGDSEQDWVIFLCNNITNMYNDWPLSERELTDYVKTRYSGRLNDIHHYETNDIRDDSGRLVVKAGIEVNANYRYYTPQGTLVPNASIPISNWEYEKAINDQKSNIWLLRPEYVETFIDEFEQLIAYAPNDEIEDVSGIKFTPNAINETFVIKKIDYSTEYGRTAGIQFASGLELVNKVVTTTQTESGATVTTSVSQSETTSSSGVNSSGVEAGTTDASSTSGSGTSGSSSSSSSGSSSGSSGGSSGSGSSGSSGSSGGGGYGGY